MTARSKWHTIILVAVAAVCATSCEPELITGFNVLEQDMTAARWVKLAKTLDTMIVTSHIVNRACVGCPDDSLTVDIGAVKDNFLIGTDIPNTGIVTARILGKNDEAGSDALYGFSNGLFAYFLVVMPPADPKDPDNIGRWKLVQLSYSANGNGGRDYQFIGDVTSGIFVSCHHTPVNQADADFKSCEEAAMSQQDVAPTRPTHSAGIRATSTVWVRCTGGCCTARK